MIYLTFDPGKKGGLCAMNDREKILALHPMPMVTVTERKKERHEYGVARIRQIVAGLLERDHVTAVVEGQQTRSGQRVGPMEDRPEYAAGLLVGLCWGVGCQRVTIVYPASWMNFCYRGMVEQCSCGVRIEGEVKLVRERTVVRKSGKHAGERDTEIGRFCPKCLAPIDGKLRSVWFCQREFPRASLLATEKSSVPHDGLADSLCLAAWAVRTNA